MRTEHLVAAVAAVVIFATGIFVGSRLGGVRFVVLPRDEAFGSAAWSSQLDEAMDGLKDESTSDAVKLRHLDVLGAKILEATEFAKEVLKNGTEGEQAAAGDFLVMVVTKGAQAMSEEERKEFLDKIRRRP